MDKKIKITSVAAAALASLVLANANLNNEVKADTKPVNATTKAQTPEEAAQANIDSAKKNVETEQGNVDKAKGDLTQAKKDAEKTDADYKAQSDKVNGLKKTADQKNNALTNAQDKEKAAQALADEANDPAKVQQANDDVTAKNTALTNAQTAETTANQNVTDQENKVGQKQQNVVDLTKVRDQKQTAKDNADQSVKNAEDALKGTGITEAKQKLDAATDAKTKAQQALNTANTNVQNKENSVTSAEQAVTQANTAKTNAERQQSAAQSEATAADTAASQANAAVSDKQKQIDKLKGQLSNLGELTKNTIDLQDVNKFKQAYADYLADGRLTDADIQWAKDAGAANHFESSDADKKVLVDVNNMTDNQLKELSLFTADLLNKVRSQLGLTTGADVVTKGSLDFTRKVAERYVSDFNNGSWTPDWHDATGINELSKNSGLNYNDGTNGLDPTKWQMYEDKSEARLSNPVSMDLLKQNIYSSLLDMIIPGGHGLDHPGATPTYEMAHTRGLLGITLPTKDELEQERDYILQHMNSGYLVNGGYLYGQDFINYADSMLNKINNHRCYVEENNVEKGQYVAATFSMTDHGSYDGTKYMNIHFINISSNEVNDPSKFDTTPIESYADQISALNNQLDTAQAALSGLSATAATANNKKNEKDAALVTAKAAVHAAQATLDEANQNLSTANTVLAQAQQDQQTKSTAWDNANDAFNAAQARYDTLTASHDQKVRKFNAAVSAQQAAKAALDTAENNLKAANVALTDAQNELKHLKNVAKDKAAAVTQAQNLLNAAKQHVQDLQNASQLLQAATIKADQAETAYKAAQKAVSEAETKLNTLASAKATADRQKQAAKTAYDTAVTRLHQAQDRLAQAQAALNSLQYVSNVTETTTKHTTNVTKDFVLTCKSVVYNENGDPVRKDGKSVTLPKGSTIHVWNNGELVTIKGKKFYQIAENEFIKANNTRNSSVKKTAAKKAVRLSHNAFVYDKHGKAIRKGLHYKLYRRDDLVKLTSAKIVTIHGKKYYQVGKDQFIKVSNTKLTTNRVNFKARVKGKVRTYTRSGKFNKHYLNGKYVYTFNEKVTVKGKTYYKVAGTNDWVLSSQLILKK